MELFAPSARAQARKRGTWAELPNLISLLLFLGGTALAFRSWEFALIVTASLGFHELGHAVAIRSFGREYRISFGLAGAWTWSRVEERKRLSHLQNVIIHLAGPVASLLLSLVALCLWQIFPKTGPHLGILANFSAQVGVLNLLPLWGLTDGGKVMRRLMLALDGDLRGMAVMLPMTFTVLLLLADNLLALPHIEGVNSSSYWISIIMVGLWVGASLVFEARRRPLASEDSMRRVTANQAFVLILIIWGLLILGITFSEATPFWLAPDYVLGVVQNVLGALHLIF